MFTASCDQQSRIQLFGHFVEQESTPITSENQITRSVFSEIELVFQMEEKHAGVIQQPGKTQQRQGHRNTQYFLANQKIVYSDIPFRILRRSQDVYQVGCYSRSLYPTK